MTAIGIIEVNDAGLRFAAPDATVIESPGVALVNGKSLLLGNEALQQARLHPVNTNSQFWHRLSAEPLPMHNAQYRHHADLAYSHLLNLHQQHSQVERIIFALPGTFTREQMSLLLGIAGQCPFTPTGLVDSAVAAAATAVTQPQALHVELQLHQVVFTNLSANHEVKREAVEVLPRAGLLAMRERWAKFLADQFIEQSRFDPLHSAATEQALYDRIPTWLKLAQTETDLFLEVSGKTAKLSRDEFMRPVRDIYALLLEKAEQLSGSETEILFSDRFTALPGMAQQLASLPRSSRMLDSHSVIKGIRDNLELLASETSALTFVQSLPVKTRVETAQPGSANVIEETPTHLLIDAVAYPLRGHTWFLHANEAELLSKTQGQACVALVQTGDAAVSLMPQAGAKLDLNGQVVRDNIRLRKGDRIRIAGIAEHLRLIRALN